MSDIAKQSDGCVSESAQVPVCLVYSPFRSREELEVAFRVLLALYAGLAQNVLSSDCMEPAKSVAARHVERMGISEENFECYTDELPTYWFVRRQANPMSGMMP